MMSVVIAMPGRAAFIFSQISTNFSFLYGLRISRRMRSDQTHAQSSRLAPFFTT
jgi:hypothetical protein